MPKQNTDVLEVLICQVGKCRDIDSILGKVVAIFGQPELFEPNPKSPSPVTRSRR
jgi:hypothetical protein